MTGPRGFYDARCGKCNRTMGWCGQYKDRPLCPHCGAPPPEMNGEEQQALDALLQALRDRALKEDSE